MRGIFEKLKRLVDAVSWPVKLLGLAGVLSSSAIFINRHFFYRVDWVGALFLAATMLFLVSASAALIEWTRKRRPPNYDKSRGRALMDASNALRRTWAHFIRFEDDDRQRIFKCIEEFHVAADVFTWDARISERTKRVRKAVQNRMQMEMFNKNLDPDSYVDAVDEFFNAIDDLTKSLHWANEQ